jgi:hypothetical protein
LFYSFSFGVFEPWLTMKLLEEKFQKGETTYYQKPSKVLQGAEFPFLIAEKETIAFFFLTCASLEP